MARFEIFVTEEAEKDLQELKDAHGDLLINTL